ncbi:MAG: AAA family ATPase [Phycisphaerales bacterium]|nr:MAG: AAA family ATPase [Phycisphaerales bacterium]
MSTVTQSRLATRRPADSRPGPPRSRLSAGGVDPLRVLRRHVLGIIAAAILGAVIGLASFFLAKKFWPFYYAEAIFEAQPGLTGGATEVATAEFANDDTVARICATETERLTDRDNVLAAALKNPEILQTEWIKKFELDTGGYDWEEAKDELEEDLKTPVIRGTTFFAVGWSSHRAEDVPIVVNAVARAYRDWARELDMQVHNTTLATFQQQLADSQRELDILNEDIKTFIREKGITTLDDPRYSQLAFKAQGLAEQIAEAAAALSIMDSAYQQTAAKLAGEMEPTEEDRLAAERDPTVQGHMQLLVSLGAERRRRIEKYAVDHPLIGNLERQIRATEAELEVKMDEIIMRNLGAQMKMLTNQAEQYRELIDGLGAELDTTETLLKDLAAEQAEYDAMEMRREFLEVSRDMDLALIKEVRLMRMRVEASQVRLAVPALTPRELSFPRWEIMTPLGVLLFTGAFIGIVFLREITDQRVKSASDLAILPGATIVGAIPERSEDPTNCQSAELVVQTQPNSVLAESYRQSFAHVVRAVQRAGHQTILLVGGLPGAGTTTAVTNFAAVAAASGRKVLAIDANFRRPRLAQAMGVSAADPGLGDILVDGLDPSDVVQETELGVAVISAGTPAKRIFDRFNTEQFDSVLAQIRGSYDMVFIDAPPAVVAGDAMVLANKVDAAVLVVRANQEHRGLVARLISQLSDVQSELLGLLLNRPRGTAGGYFKKNYAAMARYTAGQTG